MYRFLNPFLHLEAENKDSNNGAAKNFFGLSYFVTALYAKNYLNLSNFFGLDQNFSNMGQIAKLWSENVGYELFEPKPNYFGPDQNLFWDLHIIYYSIEGQG